VADSLPAPVQVYLDRNAVTDARVVALTGDASDRRYFRIIPRQSESFVLAVYASPFEFNTLPFVNTTQLFAAMPVPVPRILGHAEDAGVLALEDLGDVTLQAHLGSASPARHAALYREAVAYIDTIQRRGKDLDDPAYLPYRVRFDVEKLTWEMDFFIKHFLEAYKGVTLTAAERDAVRSECAGIVEELAAEPSVLCHRDYHSRNLMLRGEHLCIIDFQDARMGPDTYDLVSLLRDSYVDLPWSVVDDLIAYFLALQGRTAERDSFRSRFDLMALQRNLKALGTFGYQTTARGNPVYLQYIPRTLNYVRENVRRYPRFGRLADLLSAHVAELR
jgi:aminoglycoside/choline kinase family phosphotransferase